MTEKQHEFCRDFKALMEKYSITKAYGDHRHGVLHFVSNGLDFVVYSYFADRNLAPVDEFICNDCGLHLKDWVRVEITDEYDEDHYEYEFEFCPSCGAKIIKE